MLAIRVGVELGKFPEEVEAHYDKDCLATTWAAYFALKEEANRNP